jgi:hypothetical protein
MKADSDGVTVSAFLAQRDRDPLHPATLRPEDYSALAQRVDFDPVAEDFHCPDPIELP